MGFKQGNIKNIGATTGPTPEFYGMPFNLDRADPNISGMAMKTSREEKQPIVFAFGLSRWLDNPLMKGQTVTHPAIGTDHTNNVRWRDEFYVQ